MNRRQFYRYGTIALGKVAALLIAVPGIGYLLSPLWNRTKATGFRPLTRLGELKEGVPQAFPIVEERIDAWVKYPREPVGSVWLVRQPSGSKTPVVAFTSECPHLGCAVNLAEDGKSFRCPCHNSGFALNGAPNNQVPPRGMDSLEIELSSDSDPEVRVRFQRFRAQDKEKIPLE